MDSIRLGLISTVSIATVALGLITYASNRTSRINRLFFILCSLVATYTVVNYLADADADHALFWVRLTFGLAVLMLHITVLFAAIFPRTTLKRPFAVGLGIVSLIAFLLSLSQWLVPSITRANGVSSVVSGPLYPGFFLYVGLMLAIALSLMVHSYRTSRTIDRTRVTYLLLGVGLTSAALLITNLIIPTISHNNALSVLGSVDPLFFVVCMTIAIIRHRLFNIRLLVTRSVAYGLLLGAAAGLYGIMTFSIPHYLFPGIGGAQEVINIVMALFLAFTFQPLRRFFEKITDRIFYRERYDSQVVLNDFTKILVSELDLDRILKRSLANLCESIHIQYAQIVVYNHDRVYRIEHYGPLPQRLMIAPELAQLNRPMLIADEMGGGARKSLLERHGLRISMTLRTSEEFVGYLLLGDKLSGDIYSTQDVNLLEIIGKELAVAILNAKAYAEIQAFNLTLQARVDHATNRLRVANRHLKELDHAKDEFISMASHQLRTPLTTIKGYLSMMLEGDAGPMSATQKDFVGYAFGSSERMVNLISDLLNVSRLSAGRFLIQTKPTDVVQMVSDEVRQLQSHAKAKNIALIFEPPTDGFPLVELDDNKTRQVIMNFIDNAIYYTQAGEVRVTIELVGNDNMRLEVRDTGIGVPEAAKKKLFSKFFRADNAQVVRPDGTGLGLYLAKRVVEDQGGSIIFSSVEGKGSTFGFELPLKPAPPLKKSGRIHAASK